jgi:uncharacterized protein
MDLKTTFTNDMKTAMKEGNSLKLGVVRMLISEVKKREIDKRTPLEPDEILKTIQTMIKQRLDSVDQFTKGNRPELAEKEQQEIAILKAYLPAQLSAAEVEAIVDAAIAEAQAKTPADVGKVMKLALAKAGGRADGKVVNELARKKLSGS